MGQDEGKVGVICDGGVTRRGGGGGRFRRGLGGKGGNEVGCLSSFYGCSARVLDTE